MAALRLEGAAWGGAPVVDQDGAALGEHGLLKIVLRHGPPGAGKIIPDALGRGLVEHQLLSKRLGQHVFRQVIAGGAQPPGGDDDISPPLSGGHRLPGPLGVVPHHGVPVDVQAQGAEPLGEDLGVQVDDVAQQQLSAHGQDLYSMRHEKDLQENEIGGAPVRGRGLPPPRPGPGSALPGAGPGCHSRCGGLPGGAPPEGCTSSTGCRRCVPPACRW